MNKTANNVTLMTIHEAAQTGIMPENTLRRMCRNNEVPCLHIGNRTFINLDVLISFLSDPQNYLNGGKANE